MTRVLLVRHAPTDETGRKLTGRLPGVSLGEKGRAQAEQTAANLAALKIAAIYSSPIERTWETAQIIGTVHGIEPVAEDGILEVDYGAWAGRTLASLSKLKAWRTVQVTPSRMVFPGGEGLLDAQQRAVSAVLGLAGVHKKDTIVLVSHGDIIASVLSHFLGQPLDLFQRIGVSPTSVSVVDIPVDGPARVVAMNTTGDPSSWR